MTQTAAQDRPTVGDKRVIFFLNPDGERVYSVYPDYPAGMAALKGAPREAKAVLLVYRPAPGPAREEEPFWH